jgi:hypothetical protein
MSDLGRRGPASPPTDAKPPSGISERDERGLGELVKEMTSELSELFRKEIALAKVETKEEAAKAAKAGGIFAGAGLAGWLAVIFLSFALAWVLDAVMPRWLAFFLVGMVYAAAAAVLFLQGRKTAKGINPVPEQTVETLKEDLQWAKAQKS